MQTPSFSDLQGKVCAITGGGGVIGTALVKGLASVGVKCAILDIAAEPAQKLAESVREEFDVEAAGVEANVLERDSLVQARETVQKKLGPIDILINGAGGNSPKATTKVEFMTPEHLQRTAETFFGLDIDGFRRVFDLNFIGTLLPSMTLTSDMLENGSGVVLNVSSMNAFRPLTKIPAYSAAKASINNFTEWLSVHLAKTGIRVNAIAPGFFLTQQNKFLLTDEKTGELTPRGRKIIEGTPMGRFGVPDELVGTMLYLLSDLSGFVTGVVIPVDGGFNAFSGV